MTLVYCWTISQHLNLSSVCCSWQTTKEWCCSSPHCLNTTQHNIRIYPQSTQLIPVPMLVLMSECFYLNIHQTTIHANILSIVAILATIDHLSIKVFSELQTLSWSYYNVVPLHESKKSICPLTDIFYFCIFFTLNMLQIIKLILI